MRYTVLPFVLLLALASCQENDNSKTDKAANTSLSNRTDATAKDSSQYTTIEWMETSKNFGKVTEGQKVEVAFHFKNTGNKPLVIERVQPGCGCTVAETPKEPIQPGKEGVIKGAFDSNGRVGMQHKSIYVETNTKDKQSHELVFELEVVKKS
jgi:hypothetical protein